MMSLILILIHKLYTFIAYTVSQASVMVSVKSCSCIIIGSPYFVSESKQCFRV
jgi:hypothetical protein